MYWSLHHREEGMVEEVALSLRAVALREDPSRPLVYHARPPVLPDLQEVSVLEVYGFISFCSVGHRDGLVHSECDSPESSGCFSIVL